MRLFERFSNVCPLVNTGPIRAATIVGRGRIEERSTPPGGINKRIDIVRARFTQSVNCPYIYIAPLSGISNILVLRKSTDVSSSGGLPIRKKLKRRA
jgi:hypothetical protein